MTMMLTIAITRTTTTIQFYHH